MTHLKRTREFAVDAGQGELKYGATRLIRFRPQLAPMSMDDKSGIDSPMPVPLDFVV